MVFLNSGMRISLGTRAVSGAAIRPVTPVATAVTLAASSTTTLHATLDNLVMTSSTDASTAGRSYPAGELAVRCNWLLGPLGQDYVCARSLLSFDLSALAGKTIESATLRLTTKTRGVGLQPRTWHIWALASPWNSNVTWNAVASRNHYTAITIATLNPPTAEAQLISVDLTAMVQSWANGTWAHHGLLLESNGYVFPNATSLDAFAFHSLEARPNLGPRLTVSYR